MDVGTIIGLDCMTTYSVLVDVKGMVMNTNEKACTLKGISKIGC